MVSSRGTLVKKKFAAKDSLNKPAYYLQFILANSIESFKVNWLEVGYRNEGTNNFAHL